jgi:hypothetical protein
MLVGGRRARRQWTWTSSASRCTPLAVKILVRTMPLEENEGGSTILDRRRLEPRRQRCANKADERCRIWEGGSMPTGWRRGARPQSTWSSSSDALVGGGDESMLEGR